MALLGPHAVFKKQEELVNIEKDIKKYLIENAKEIVKENMVYMSKDAIELMQEIPSNGIIEIDFEKNVGIKEMFKEQEYLHMLQIGIAFAESNDLQIKIHIPLINEIKQSLKDKEIQKRNKEFNEKVDVIKGICEVHGAIKTIDVYNIMQEFYGKTEEEEFLRLLILVCGVLNNAGIKMDMNTGKFENIYHISLDEEIAEDIINSKEEVIREPKASYIKYSADDFLKTTKGYKRLEKQLCSQVFLGDELFEMLSSILFPYTLEKRLNSGKAETILKILVEQLEEYGELLPMTDINIDEIKKAFEEIASEYPRWKD